MQARFKDLVWIKGGCSLSQGHRGGYVPENAIAGSNGSFVVPIPAELHLQLVTPNGRVVSQDIVSIVRAVNGWQRITEKRFSQLKEKLRNVENFNVDFQDKILGLSNLVKLSK